MNHMNAIIKFLVVVLISSNLNSFSQEIKKDTIYFLFEKNNDCLDKYKKKFIKGYNFKNNTKFKFSHKDGVVFNLYCNEGKSFLFKKEFKSDTLCINKLDKYTITTKEEFKKIEGEWYDNNKKAIIKKYGKLHPPFLDKNSRYITYIIEILEHENKFVIYPVIWRNQNIIE